MENYDQSKCLNKMLKIQLTVTKSKLRFDIVIYFLFV